MSASTQMSAHISEETRALVEAYVKSHGVKKAHLVEEALRHHLQALREIPDDLIISTRLLVSAESLASISSQLATPPEPTDALRALL